ncbi:MAG TPA: hypothetical protein VNW15_01960 [Rhizomicrobium sp.]|jgi:hypothetical protein|nr:hypothetical protein [Rhizomicrobium sp.]
MDRRITTRKVKFRHSFWLSGFEQPQPAGSYTIDTNEEPLYAVSSAGWQHVSTTIQLCRYGMSEHVSIDPRELFDVLLRDSLDPAPVWTQDRANKLQAGRA